MVWNLNHGSEVDNIELMKASFQKIPEHLKNRVEIEPRCLLIYGIYNELRSDRDYIVTMNSVQMKPFKSYRIIEKLERFGFKDYEIEELKDVIFQMDRAERDYDNARLRIASLAEKAKKR